MRSFAIIVMTLSILAGCGTDKNERSEVQKAERQDGTGPSFTVQSSGLSLSKGRVLAVDITQTSTGDARPDQAILETCLRPFSADDELGTIECATGKPRVERLYAKHVRQICAGVSTFKAIEPKEELLIKGCNQVVIKAFKFKPSITFAWSKN